MVNVLLYERLDGSWITGISPRDIIENLFPNIPRQKKSEPQITIEEIAAEVQRLRTQNTKISTARNLL